MRWVTRSHVHVDRVACPWLISRFIDSEAEFLFVAPSQVATIAEEEDAIPFDTPGVALNHRGDSVHVRRPHRGVRPEGPRSPPYGPDRQRRRHRPARLPMPLAAGLEAIAVGYSLRHPDDLENLERQFEVYDALYAWCRLDVAATQ